MNERHFGLRPSGSARELLVKSSQVKSSQVKSLESDVVVARLSCVSLGNLAGGSTPAPAASTRY